MKKKRTGIAQLKNRVFYLNGFKKKIFVIEKVKKMINFLGHLLSALEPPVDHSQVSHDARNSLGRFAALQRAAG